MDAPLVAENVSRSFGVEIAIDDLDLRVEESTIHAIVGLNGAGKTTLMRLLLGMLRPDSGTATVFGHQARSAPAAIWSRVGHLIETPFAYRELTVRENVKAAALLHGMDCREANLAVDRSIADFELGHWAERKAGTLSQGNRQRLGLASALVHQPSVVVLDEPANSLDPAGVVFTREMLQGLAAQGAAVLVSSHHLDQLARVAHHISVMHRGSIVGQLDPSGTNLEEAFFETVHAADAVQTQVAG